jgi:hypothetical protein
MSTVGEGVMPMEPTDDHLRAVYQALAGRREFRQTFDEIAFHDRRVHEGDEWTPLQREILHDVAAAVLAAPSSTPSEDTSGLRLPLGMSVQVNADCYGGLQRGDTGQVIEPLEAESVVRFDRDSSERLIINSNLLPAAD